MKLIPSKLYNKWFSKLDKLIQIVILHNLAKLSKENFQSCKALKGTDSIFEIVINFQKGYRIYFIKEQNNIILLLCAGVKDDQARDIERAKGIQKRFNNGGNIL